MGDEARQRAVEIARALLERVRSLVGQSRDEVDAAMKAVDVGPREHRLKDGLAKLILDDCEFDSHEEVDLRSLRREVFSRASATRAALAPGERFDRASVLAVVAQDHCITVEAIEALLFSDLRGAQVLRSCSASDAEALVADYPRAQAQAVLLRAIRVTVDVECASVFAFRALFRRLKFLRLLYVISREVEGYRIVIDGPCSLFESVTKYGLQLACALPVLDDCDSWKLSADIRWGKEKTPLVFRMVGGLEQGAGARSQPESNGWTDEVSALVRNFEALESPWRVSANVDIVELPGIGLCIPDLVFEGRSIRGAAVRVYFEVMGYWSRSAVWQRIELVQAGLREKVLFAVSSRLRVSEEVLGDDVPAALYVYKHTMSARSVRERLDRLAGAD